MPRYKDITGDTWNQLTAIKFIEMKNGMAQWLFKCTCGKETIKRANNVKNGLTHRCSPKCSLNPKYKNIKRKLKNSKPKENIEKKDLNIINRIGKTTPHKRCAQVGMIKQIQQKIDNKTLKGDLLQTPGPGNVALNYWIFERLLEQETNYIALENNLYASKLMYKEMKSLRKRLKEQVWSNKVEMETEDIFKYSIKHLLKGKKIGLVDACLCKTASTLVKEGTLEGINALCATSKFMKENLFLSLTFSLRYNKTKDKEALDQILEIIKRYNGDMIYKYSYADGTPMKTMAWHFNNKAA